MMCFIHYISASRRLTEVEKTVKILGEDDVQSMILAQRDFIIKEKEYFGDECKKWTIRIVGFIIGIAVYQLVIRNI